MAVGEQESDTERSADRDDNSQSRYPPGIRQRLRARAVAAQATPMDAPSPPVRSTKWRIDRLDPRERMFSFAGSGLAAVFAVVIYVVETNDKHFRLKKGQLTPQTILILGLVFAGLLLVATLVARRAPVGFVALFTFFTFGTYSYVIGLPFLVLAGWVLYRSYKIQKEAAAAARSTRSHTSSARAPSPRGTTTQGRAGGPARSAKAGSKTAASARSEPNKRYTPKRPPPVAPKPSRRERKAAQSSD